MQPRRAQRPITIRSDKAAARLAILTRGGRSQAEVIEDALERLPEPVVDSDRLARLARIDAALTRLQQRTDLPTMVEFDAREYDGRGNPR